MKSTLAMHSILETAVLTADIVMIQEPWIGPNITTVSHPSFDCILPGGVTPTSHPRVALFFSKTHPSLRIQPRDDLLQDPDAQAFEVQTPAIPPILIYNIYNQKDGNGDFTLERLFTSNTTLA